MLQRVRSPSVRLNNKLLYALKASYEKVTLRKKSDMIDMRAVAARAGVSAATVSRVVNRLPSVNALLTARVWKAVDELDFFLDTHARALVSGKSKLFGLIISAITNPFFPELIQEFEQAAFAQGYDILLSSTSYEPRSMDRCVRRMLARTVEGIAVMSFEVEDLSITQSGTQIPMIFTDPPGVLPYGDSIAVDYNAGILEGVQHLAAIGHRKIGFISGPLHLHSARLRKIAFMDSLRHTGLPINPAWLLEGEHTLESGRDATIRLLALPGLPTAVMCSDDLTAIGVQHALFSAGFKVPDDLSVIGLGDVNIAGCMIPPLTTIRISCRELARAAVDTLVFRSSSPEHRSEPLPLVCIGTRLIVRRTTARPRMSQFMDAELFGSGWPSNHPARSA